EAAAAPTEAAAQEETAEADTAVEADTDAPAPAPRPATAPATKQPDRVFLPHAKDAIPIRPNTAEMFVLQHLRDEAHRFAVTFHRQQRKRLTLRSALSTIPGIGAGRQRSLLRPFGSLKKIREASLEDLLAVPGVTRKAAEAVFSHWGRQPAAPVEAPEAPGQSAGPEAEEDALDSAFAAIE